MSEKKTILLLVDGNALLYRAYHAFPKEFTSPSGELVGAVYGFARVLMATIKQLKPTCAAVAFDLSGPTFRHEQYDGYKATRQKMPEELAGQIDRVHQIVEFLEIPIYTAESFEADDVIGTIARQTEKHDPEAEIVVLTGDQDMIQLVTKQVSILMPGIGQKPTVRYTPKEVMERYGFEPLQMIEYKALRGDTSDNIPGVPGIGEVGGTKLIQEFGSIDHLYEELKANRAESVKGALRQKLIDGEESAHLSHELATIRTNAPVTIDLKNCVLSLHHPEKLIALFKELGFKSLLNELPTSHLLSAAAADVFSQEALVLEIEELVPSGPIYDPTKPLDTSDQINGCLSPILREMEERGVKIDLPYLRSLEKEFDGDIAALKKKLIDLAGEEFNPDSPSQVSRILYEVLHIPTTFVRKSKTGYTTDAATLEELKAEYPIASLLLQYREVVKLQNTYVRPLQQIPDNHDRVHTSYAPDTSSGRLSSRNPNLQNIPIRTEQGRRLRTAFIAEKGCQLVAADYSQMELRVAAHLSGDQGMIDAFKSGSDFHAETAARMGVDRTTAKMINFSILYGKGAFSFAKDLGITVPEAKQYIDTYFKTYHKLREYLDGILEFGRKHGYLETMFGHRRPLPDLNSSNGRLRSAAEREALNMPIQGSQADILKKAMCDLDKRLRDEKLEARMILTVHDELVLEVPNKEVEKVADIVADTMVSAVELKVPVVVNVKVGTSWGEMSPLLTETDTK